MSNTTSGATADRAIVLPVRRRRQRSRDPRRCSRGPWPRRRTGCRRGDRRPIVAPHAEAPRVDEHERAARGDDGSELDEPSRFVSEGRSDDATERCRQSFLTNSHASPADARCATNPSWNSATSDSVRSTGTRSCFERHVACLHAATRRAARSGLPTRPRAPSQTCRGPQRTRREAIARRRPRSRPTRPRSGPTVYRGPC